MFWTFLLTQGVCRMYNLVQAIDKQPSSYSTALCHDAQESPHRSRSYSSYPGNAGV